MSIDLADLKVQIDTSDIDTTGGKFKTLDVTISAFAGSATAKMGAMGNAASAAGLQWDAAANRWRNAAGQFASSAELASAGMGKMGGAAQGAASSVDKMALSMGALMAGREMVRFGEGVMGTLAGIVEKGAAFEATMSGIKAVTGDTGVQIDHLRVLALQLGKDTVFSAAQAGTAIEDLSKNGLSYADIMAGAAKSTTSLAAATGESLTLSATVASNALNMFGLSGKDMAHVADLAAGAVNVSAISLTDYSYSLQSSGAAAHLAGVSLDDLTVAITEMGNAGIAGEKSGTMLKQLFIDLTPKSTAAGNEMRQLGIITADGSNKFYDATGKLKGLAEIQDVLRTSMAGLTKQQQTAALSVIFGTDAMQGAAIMAGQGAAGFDKVAVALGKISADDTAHQRLDNLQGDFTQLTGSIETLEIQVVTGLLPSLRGIAQWATNVANTVIDWTAQHPKLTEAIGITAAAVGVLAIGLGGLAIATGAVSLAMTPLMAVLGAVGVPLLAIGAASAALYVAWQHDFGGIREATEAAYVVVRPLLDALTDTLGKVSHAFEAGGLVAAFDALKASLPSLGDALGVVGARLSTIVSGIDWAGIGHQIADQTAQWARSLWSWVQTAGPPLLSAIGDMAGKLGTQLGLWADQFSAWVVPAVSHLLAVWPGELNRFLDWISQQVGAISPRLQVWAEQFASWVPGAVAKLLVGAAGITIALGAFIVETGYTIDKKLFTEWIPAFLRWIGPVGGQLLGAIGHQLDSFVAYLHQQVPVLEAKLEEWAGAFAAWVPGATTQLLGAMGHLLDQYGAWLSNDAVPVIEKHLEDWVLAFLNWPNDVLNQIYNSLAPLLPKLVGWVTDTALPAIRDAIVNWAVAFVGWIPGAADAIRKEFGVHITPAIAGASASSITTAVGQVAVYGPRLSQAYVDQANAAITSFNKTLTDTQTRAGDPILGATGQVQVYGPRLTQAYIDQAKAGAKAFEDTTTGSWGEAGPKIAAAFAKTIAATQTAAQDALKAWGTGSAQMAREQAAEVAQALSDGYALRSVESIAQLRAINKQLSGSLVDEFQSARPDLFAAGGLGMKTLTDGIAEMAGRNSPAVREHGRLQIQHLIDGENDPTLAAQLQQTLDRYEGITAEQLNRSAKPGAPAPAAAWAFGASLGTAITGGISSLTASVTASVAALTAAAAHALQTMTDAVATRFVASGPQLAALVTSVTGQLTGAMDAARPAFLASGTAGAAAWTKGIGMILDTAHPELLGKGEAIVQGIIGTITDAKQKTTVTNYYNALVALVGEQQDRLGAAAKTVGSAIPQALADGVTTRYVQTLPQLQATLGGLSDTLLGMLKKADPALFAQGSATATQITQGMRIALDTSHPQLQAGGLAQVQAVIDGVKDPTKLADLRTALQGMGLVITQEGVVIAANAKTVGALIPQSLLDGFNTRAGDTNAQLQDLADSFKSIIIAQFQLARPALFATGSAAYNELITAVTEMASSDTKIAAAGNKLYQDLLNSVTDQTKHAALATAGADLFTALGDKAQQARDAMAKVGVTVTQSMIDGTAFALTNSDQANYTLMQQYADGLAKNFELARPKLYAIGSPAVAALNKAITDALNVNDPKVAQAGLDALKRMLPTVDSGSPLYAYIQKEIAGLEALYAVEFPRVLEQAKLPVGTAFSGFAHDVGGKLIPGLVDTINQATAQPAVDAVLAKIHQIGAAVGAATAGPGGGTTLGPGAIAGQALAQDFVHGYQLAAQEGMGDLLNTQKGILANIHANIDAYAPIWSQDGKNLNTALFSALSAESTAKTPELQAHYKLMIYKIIDGIKDPSVRKALTDTVNALFAVDDQITAHGAAAGNAIAGSITDAYTTRFEKDAPGLALLATQITTDLAATVQKASPALFAAGGNALKQLTDGLKEMADASNPQMQQQGAAMVQALIDRIADPAAKAKAQAEFAMLGGTVNEEAAKIAANPAVGTAGAAIPQALAAGITANTPVVVTAVQALGAAELQAVIASNAALKAQADLGAQILADAAAAAAAAAKVNPITAPTPSNLQPGQQMGGIGPTGPMIAQQQQAGAMTAQAFATGYSQMWAAQMPQLQQLGTFATTSMLDLFKQVLPQFGTAGGDVMKRFSDGLSMMADTVTPGAAEKGAALVDAAISSITDPKQQAALHTFFDEYRKILVQEGTLTAKDATITAIAIPQALIDGWKLRQTQTLDAIGGLIGGIGSTVEANFQKAAPQMFASSGAAFGQIDAAIKTIQTSTDQTAIDAAKSILDNYAGTLDDPVLGKAATDGIAKLGDLSRQRITDIAAQSKITVQQIPTAIIDGWKLRQTETTDALGGFIGGLGSVVEANFQKAAPGMFSSSGAAFAQIDAAIKTIQTSTDQTAIDAAKSTLDKYATTIDDPTYGAAITGAISKIGDLSTQRWNDIAKQAAPLGEAIPQSLLTGYKTRIIASIPELDTLTQGYFANLVDNMHAAEPDVLAANSDMFKKLQDGMRQWATGATAEDRAAGAAVVQSIADGIDDPKYAALVRTGMANVGNIINTKFSDIAKAAGPAAALIPTEIMQQINLRFTEGAAQLQSTIGGLTGIITSTLNAADPVVYASTSALMNQFNLGLKMMTDTSNPGNQALGKSWVDAVVNGVTDPTKQAALRTAVDGIAAITKEEMDRNQPAAQAAAIKLGDSVIQTFATRLTDNTGQLSDTIHSYTDNIIANFQRAAPDLFATGSQLMKQLTQGLQEMADAQDPAVQAEGLKMVQDLIAVINNPAIASELGTNITNLGDLFGILFSKMKATTVPVATATGQAIASAVGTGIAAGIPAVEDAAAQLADKLQMGFDLRFTSSLSDLHSLTGQYLDTIVKDFQAGNPDLFKTGGGAMDQIFLGLKDMADTAHPDLQKLGLQMVTALLDGVTDPKLKSILQGAIQNYLDLINMAAQKNPPPEFITGGTPGKDPGTFGAAPAAAGTGTSGGGIPLPGYNPVVLPPGYHIGGNTASAASMALDALDAASARIIAQASAPLPALTGAPSPQAGAASVAAPSAGATSTSTQGAQIIHISHPITITLDGAQVGEAVAEFTYDMQQMRRQM